MQQDYYSNSSFKQLIDHNNPDLGMHGPVVGEGWSSLIVHRNI